MKMQIIHLFKKKLDKKKHETKEKKNRQNHQPIESTIINGNQYEMQ